MATADESTLRCHSAVDRSDHMMDCGLLDIRPGRQRFATSALLSRKKGAETLTTNASFSPSAVREAGPTQPDSRRHPQSCTTLAANQST